MTAPLKHDLVISQCLSLVNTRLSHLFGNSNLFLYLDDFFFVDKARLTLHYFCTHISQSVSHRTVMVYLAGIRLLHIENGLTDLTKNAPLLHYLLTAIRRPSVRKPLQRHPITSALLVTLKTQLHQSDRASRDRALFGRLFLWQIMDSYVHVSTFHHHHITLLYLNPKYHLLWSNIQIREESIRIQLSRSKTDPMGPWDRTFNLFLDSPQD